jgi:CHAT domain-containing protein/Tfp pilus assembly protein PilF
MRPRIFLRVMRCLFLCSTVICSYASFANSKSMEQGQTAFDRGDFVQAIEQWESILTKVNEKQQLHLLTQLAISYQSIGSLEESRQYLQRALTLAEKQGDQTYQAIILSTLSDVYLATQQVDNARNYADKALEIAKRSGDNLALAHALNNLGNILSVQQKYTESVSQYEQAIDLSKKSGDEVLAMRALLNRVQAAFYNAYYEEALQTSMNALNELKKLPETHDKAFGLVSLGRLGQRIQKHIPANSDLTALIYESLEESRKLAEKLKDDYAASYAYGHLGELYEYEKRYVDALQLTRRAIFHAQRADSKETLYRWHWQSGRLFKAMNKYAESIDAYRRAINNLQPIRDQLSTVYRSSSESFEKFVEPVYFELADLLLQRAKNSTESEQRENWLIQARDTLELLKAAELEDYFQDDCVTALKAKMSHLEKVDKKTAILYPIVLADRMEILLSLHDKVEQFIIPIDRETFKQTVQDFRKNLTIRTHYKFLIQSQQLYQWLIAPLSESLKKYAIDTLVIVPDSILRTVPLAALHDGQHFLIENIALATTPGLTLTDPKSIKQTHISMLLNGLSEGVQGFSPLPNVPEELQNIQSLYTATLLKDKNFSIDNVENALKKQPYTIIHVASHGQFDRDPSKTFLLTYDDKLTINRLEKLMRLSEFRQEPVELLTLSACQTAVGDERAALGLAGIAIKAGARSALATLWFIDDTATSILVSDFYHQLQKPLSKAKALQNAQKIVLAQRRFRHPAYWSAFLLIGNWL